MPCFKNRDLIQSNSLFHIKLYTHKLKIILIVQEEHLYKYLLLSICAVLLLCGTRGDGLTVVTDDSTLVDKLSAHSDDFVDAINTSFSVDREAEIM